MTRKGQMGWFPSYENSAGCWLLAPVDVYVSEKFSSLLVGTVYPTINSSPALSLAGIDFDRDYSVWRAVAESLESVSAELPTFNRTSRRRQGAIFGRK
jgi:hypothetical protein